MNRAPELFAVSYSYWLMVFALSVLVTTGYVVRMAFGKSERFVPWNRVTAFAAALTLCLVAVDGLNIANRQVAANMRLAVTVAVIAATVWLTWLHLKHVKTQRNVFVRRPSAWFLLICSAAMTGWSSFQFRKHTEAKAKPFLIITTPGPKSQVHEFVALTDRNHPIKVYRLDDSDPDSANDEAVVMEYAGAVIQRAKSHPLANCHGWVFLDGEFLISGEAVERILGDNQYEVVDEPMANDVIIYRDDDRNILHSGVVRGVLSDSTVLIESKWGTEGVFLHSPMDTPYSGDWQYYRSPRPTHRVKVVSVDELPMDE
jgi:hypothetical protein